MAPVYELYIRNAAGTLLARRTDFLNISISRIVNAADIAVFTYSSAQTYATPDLVIGYIVEIYRRDDEWSIPVTQEFAGIIRRIKKTIGEQTIYECTCLGMVGLLAQRIVAYRSSGFCTFTTAQPAETVAKTLFNYNCNVQATTANGRILNGTINGFTTTASAGTGSLVSGDFAYMNLLSALQKVAEDGGGDFDLLYTSSPSAYTFVWYNGQRGTDRTATVRISVPLGTASEFVAETDLMSGFFNTSIVGGTGEALGRLISVAPVTPPNNLNRYEQFIDARNQKKSTAQMLFDLGTAERIRQIRSYRRYTATVLQTSSLLYGRDYFLGDLVTVQDETVLITQRVAGVDIDFSSEGKEDVNITLTDNN